MTPLTAMFRYDCDAYIDMTRDLCDSMSSSVKMLEEHLAKGYSVYGTTPISLTRFPCPATRDTF